MNDAEIQRAQKSALDMLAKRRPLPEILTFLVQQAEAVSGGSAVCSVLLLDKEGLLRNGASPGLPADYLQAIDRLKPDPGVGTCAAAAATGKIVITPDLLTDAGWKELRHLPLALGMKAAWSVPIVADDGRILGTFGTYFRERRSPRPEERTTIEALAQVARTVIESFRAPAVTPAL
jgi:GAF domain-containing protein